MTNHRTKLKTLLRELFQFDAADLDFGIYRIMNQRRAEIDDFVEKGLLDAVAQEFTLLREGIVEEKREELNRVARRIREAYYPGVIDEQGNLTLPEQFMQAELPVTYVRLQTEVKRASVSAEAEAEIFNALYTFFSRYYDRGDFVTKRRYSRLRIVTWGRYLEMQGLLANWQPCRDGSVFTQRGVRTCLSSFVGTASLLMFGPASTPKANSSNWMGARRTTSRRERESQSSFSTVSFTIHTYGQPT